MRSMRPPKPLLVRKRVSKTEISGSFELRFLHAAHHRRQWLIGLWSAATVREGNSRLKPSSPVRADAVIAADHLSRGSDRLELAGPSPLPHCFSQRLTDCFRAQSGLFDFACRKLLSDDDLVLKSNRAMSAINRLLAKKGESIYGHCLLRSSPHLSGPSIDAKEAAQRNSIATPEWRSPLKNCLAGLSVPTEAETKTCS